jgi:hypothetical protein
LFEEGMRLFCIRVITVNNDGFSAVDFNLQKWSFWDFILKKVKNLVFKEYTRKDYYIARKRNMVNERDCFRNVILMF